MKKHLKSDKKLFLQIILVWLLLITIWVRVYDNMGDIKALAYYEKTLEIEQKTLPSNHPDLATSYNNIGLSL